MPGVLPDSLCWISESARLGRALDECLHDFLDQRPQGKYTARNRAAGLVAAGFWLEPANLEGAHIASLALARVLHFDDVISKELLEHLAVHHPDVLRWAIRYSKLFTRSGSPLWKQLRETLSGDAWQEFFGVCDRLLQQLEPFDDAIVQAESQLKSLSLLELLSYLSVLAYERLGGGMILLLRIGASTNGSFCASLKSAPNLIFEYPRRCSGAR